MYEVIDVQRMIRVKSTFVRNRKNVPSRHNQWGGMILIRGGTPIQQLRLLPSGSEIKICMQDKTVWEVFIPRDFKKSVKLLAKRLDAIAFM